MTESSPGPGWWLASDGNWYPPHLHPDARARSAAEAQAAAAAAAPNLDRAVVADHVARVADAETATHRAPADDLTVERPHDAADGGGSIDHIVASSAGGIDWEAVARERAAQREARNRQAASTRRKAMIGGGVVLVALLAIWLVTRGGDDGGGGTTRTTAGTTTVAPSTSAAPTTAAPTTAAPSTTVASTTTRAGTGPTGPSGATGAPATTRAPGVTAVPAAQNVSVFSLAPGSCIDQENLTTGLVTTVRVVGCDQPHTHEVYLKTTVTPADATYDATKVTAFANQACTEGFKAYVGIDYDKSKYYFLHLAPSAESWNKNKDRDVVCLLLLEGQKLTGSVKGKGE